MILDKFLLRLDKVLDGQKGSGHFGHKGRPGQRGGSLPSKGSSSSFNAKIIVDKETTNEEDAKKMISDYLSYIPSNIQRESSCRSVEVFENPEDATTKLNELEPGGIESDELARGAYNRENGHMVVSLYYSEDAFLEVPKLSRGQEAYSGRNFYHEFAHSLENRITSDGWERCWGEWGFNQDEGFAEAFSSFMVSKRVERLGNKEEMQWFKRNYPETTDLFKSWGL